MMYHSSFIFSFIPLRDLLQVTWPALSTEQLTLIDQPPQCYSPIDRASLFPRSRFTSESFVKFLMCSYEGGLARFRDLGFSNQDLCRAGWKFCHVSTSTRGYRDESGINSGRSDGIVLHCLHIFNIISFPFNCTDIALSVANAMIGAKVVEIILFRFFGPFLVSETVLKFLMRTQGEIGPGNLASAVNRACVKKR